MVGQVASFAHREAQERYRTSFRQLNAVFGDLYLDEITSGRLADYASDRMKAGVKRATVRRDLATLTCPCSSVRGFKVGR